MLENMKILVVISVLVAVATAQFFPGRPFPSEDQYAASLSGAPVGLYDKKHGRGYGPFGGRGSEVVGASLGGAKVGLYGKEHQQPYRPFLPIRSYLPVKPVIPFVRPYYGPRRSGPYIRPPF